MKCVKYPILFVFQMSFTSFFQADKKERGNALNTAIDNMCKKTRDLRRQVISPGTKRVRFMQLGRINSMDEGIKQLLTVLEKSSDI